ncbi:MAG: thioredoxin-like domain-containing protein [Planctomycetota bacterium]
MQLKAALSHLSQSRTNAPRVPALLAIVAAAGLTASLSSVAAAQSSAENPTEKVKERAEQAREWAERKSQDKDQAKEQAKERSKEAVRKAGGNQEAQELSDEQIKALRDRMTAQVDAVTRDAAADGYHDTEAVAAIGRTRAAIQKTGVFVSDLVSTATGNPMVSMISFKGNAKLVAVLDPASEVSDPKWFTRVTGSATGPGTGDTPEQFDVAGRPDRTEWIDNKTGEVRTLEDGSSMNSEVLAADYFQSLTLIDGQPLDTELTLAKLTYLGESEIDGVPVVGVEAESQVRTQGSKKFWRWYLRASDSMPVALDTLFGDQTTDMSGVQRITFVNPTTDPAAADGVEFGFGLEKDAGAFGETQAGDVIAWEADQAGGETFQSTQLVGDVNVLYFWGTWCFPCKRAAPFNKEMFADYAENDGFGMFGLPVRSDPDATIKYAKDAGYEWTQLLSADSVADKYNVKAYPTWIVLDKSGSEVWRSEPSADFQPVFDAMRSAIDDALSS